MIPDNGTLWGKKASNTMRYTIRLQKLTTLACKVNYQVAALTSLPNVCSQSQKFSYSLFQV